MEDIHPSDARRPVEGLSQPELSAWLDSRGLPAYRADQIRRWLFRKRVTSFEAMTDLSGALRQALAREFVVGSLAVQQSLGSRDGSVKYLFRLQDGAVVETVYIPEPDRATLCVSTQRNLTQAEIVDQVLEVQRRCPEDTRISNLVFMGMGEPLANYDATRGALEAITDARSGMGISPRKITVSTVGLLPQMRRLMEETRVNLAISLHSVRDEVRSELMPVNRKYSVDQLLECCRSLPVPRRKRITFEYLLISGLNDLAADAAELAGKLHGIRCKVNLIPFNPHEGSGYRRPTDHVIERFGETLRARGIQANGHRLLPSEVNNRANIFGMKKLGVGRILSVSAVGSLKEEIEPGHVVLPDQFIDRTYRRPSTFFGDGIVAHVQFADPLCNDLRAVVAEAAAKEDIQVHGRGTYVCMEGPQFSTRAESALHRSWGADIIGMTNLQEAKLAREAEICFATIAMATDYDCWNEAAGDVEIEEIIAVLQKNADVAKRIIRGTLERLSPERTCPCATALSVAIVTDRSLIPEAAGRAGAADRQVSLNIQLGLFERGVLRLRFATPVLSLSKGSGRTVVDTLSPFVLSVASPELVEGRAKSKGASSQLLGSEVEGRHSRFRL
ncbi:S-methyl-5'-thioadenosine phosphorylase [Geodia barretti]|uniref:S-methyl-5'-thioadenosine phosphorylase n=1 Tax=Geodia barretti TaxID=519541 RepID=A0AA35RSR9_GEOBA|nr:S-methyl-5'-thioadenosine phosphorylase [Geodia barretti]